MGMKYGQIAEGSRVNAAIYRCFGYLEENEARKFVRRFRDQPHDRVQVMHTFRELILGTFLAVHGLRVHYDTKIESKTPDWCILDETASPYCIVELVNFNPSAETSQDVVRQIQAKGIWCNWVKPNTERLHGVISEKAARYGALADRHGLCYVVAVFGDFVACVEPEELDECLLTAETGLFELYPEVSGVVFFEESGGSYHFRYWPNPHASRAMDVPTGWLDLSQSGR
jgi:hypothetical protein